MHAAIARSNHQQTAKLAVDTDLFFGKIQVVATITRDSSFWYPADACPFATVSLAYTAGYIAAALAAAIDLPTLKTLAERGADLNTHSPTVGSLLHAVITGAYEGDKLEVLKYLHANSDVFAQVHLAVDEQGATALHAACLSGQADLVRWVTTLQIQLWHNSLSFARVGDGARAASPSTQYCQC